jgi:hypothetical protein
VSLLASTSHSSFSLFKSSLLVESIPFFFDSSVHFLLTLNYSMVQFLLECRVEWMLCKRMAAQIFNATQLQLQVVGKLVPELQSLQVQQRICDLVKFILNN